jgi:hypothetical protein
MERVVHDVQKFAVKSPSPTKMGVFVSATGEAESVLLGGALMGGSIMSVGELVVLGAGGGALMGESSTSPPSPPSSLAPSVGRGSGALMGGSSTSPLLPSPAPSSPSSSSVGAAMGVSSTSAAEPVVLGASDAHAVPLADTLEPDGADDSAPDDDDGQLETAVATDRGYAARPWA